MVPSAAETFRDKKSSEGHDVVPVIDFALAQFDDEKPLEMAKELVAAFKNSGFVYLRNHGVSQEVVNEAFSWSKKFFDLPQDVKDKVPHPPEGWWHRGYSGLGREKVTQMLFNPELKVDTKKIPDVKESFEMGKENNPKCPNIWLLEEDFPGFRSFFNRFYDIMNQLKTDVLRSIAIGMGMDKDFFVSYHQNADNQTRILHYPPVPKDILRNGNAERIGAHSDFGTITFLFQDQVGGLEIEDPHQKGDFRAVPHIPNTVLVNVGDFLQMWTNDVLKSTSHRVRAPAPIDGDNGEGDLIPARYSIPYFCGPDTEKTMECAPNCYGPDRPKKYGPTTVGQYIDAKMNMLY